MFTTRLSRWLAWLADFIQVVKSGQVYDGYKSCLPFETFDLCLVLRLGLTGQLGAHIFLGHLERRLGL